MISIRSTLQALLLVCLSSTLLMGQAQTPAKAAEAAAPAQEAAPKVPTDREIATQQAPSYPLTTCVVSGEELDAESTVQFVHEGRLYRTCCEKCKGAVMKNAAPYAEKIVKAVIAEQGKSYPLKTCAVSGEPLGSMGPAIDHVEGTKLVRFCCKGCLAGHKKDPAASMKAVDEAWIQAQLPSYPLETCIVMVGDPLDDPEEGLTPINMLYGTRLVRVCCKSCIRKFNKKPAMFIANLDAAAKAKRAEKAEAKKDA